MSCRGDAGFGFNETEFHGRRRLVSNILLSDKAPALRRETRSEEETRGLARDLGRWLVPGDWLALMGELGSGKTVFTKGLAEAFGLAESPTSPTFSLVQVHCPRRVGLCLRHVDLYRLPPAEIPALEWEELHDENGVTVVEWAEKCRSLWPPQALAIRFSHRGGDARCVEFLSVGARADVLIRRLKKAL